MRCVTNVIVAFPKSEDAKSIKNILMQNGFPAVAICTSDAQVLDCMDGLNGGILVSGHRFKDMLYREPRKYLPAGLEILLVVPPAGFSDDLPGDLVYPPMPLKVHGLINILEVMTRAQTKRKEKSRQKPRERSEEERQLITRTKELLIERNNITETEAHRCIQKCNMDNGTNMIEIAQTVMSPIHL